MARTEYFVYAGKLFLGATASLSEAREWERAHDRLRVSGPCATIKIVEFDDSNTR